MKKKMKILKTKTNDRAASPDGDPLGWAKLICSYRVVDSKHEDDVMAVQNAAIVMIVNVIQSCPEGHDRSMAISRIREALAYARDSVTIQCEVK